MGGAAHICKVQTARAILNRLILLINSIAIISLFYYRFSCFSNTHTYVSLIRWTLFTIADLLLTFVWAMSQAFRWRPVLRDVSGYESISPDELPRIDIFICTADPTKEPVLEVMNSVISSMALDYPPEKLAVYLSDDAGSPLTREAIKIAYQFAKHYWLPFCNKYAIKTRCPQAFFSALGDDDRLPWNHDFLAHQSLLKSKYEAFKTYVEKESGDNIKCRVVQDRAPYIEVIDDDRKQHNGEDEVKMPIVVYVAREKRPSHPHRFKAGALNALLRVSGVLSNAPYLLVLDCDMYCHDPTSARQSMCFHLDPNMAPSLAFVQYPQIFYNTSKNDIYDGQARSAHMTKWQGMDGLRGPVLNGTGYYMKKAAIYGSPHNEDEYLINEPEKAFGSSTQFIASLRQNPSKQQHNVGVLKEFTDDVLQEATNLATCTYEANTLWGVKLGFSYDCLLESSYGGYLLHCKGWKSVYLYPKRPCFLGCTTVDMKDAIVQLIKWTSGLLGVGLSKFSPLTYGISRMSVLQSMCYAYITFAGLLAFPLFIYGALLPLCLLKGIPVFPKMSDPWILGFVFVFVSSHAQHLYEVIASEHSVQQWWNEVRIWIMKSLTACLFGSTEAIMKKIGIHRTKFRLTNKVVEKEKLDKYESGKFDFSGAAMLMLPLTILSVLNLVSFIGGLIRVIFHKNYDDMFAQLFLSFYLLLLSYPTLQGILAKLTHKLPNKQ